MTPDAFQKLALALPEAVASSYGEAPAFSVGERIFATAGRVDGKAVLRLTREQQLLLCEAEPEMFTPVSNAWGGKGWTNFLLAKADAKTARSALLMAWKNTAPKKLVKLYPPEAPR